MDDSDDFEVVFGSNPNVAYDADTRRKIQHHRQSLENELFIDRLLKALGINEVSRSYPPGSNQDLKNLHEQITSSSSPDHHIHAVLYYLLRDISNSSHRSSDDFANASYLPHRYKTFVDGLWYLDRLRFDKALEYLAEPTLIPTFPEEILYTLCRHAPDNDVSLPVAYYHSVSPTFNLSKALEAYFLILCRANVTEAFYFSRTQGDLNHRVLFEKLIAFVHAKSSGTLKALRGVELVSLPLTKEEEDWFTAYLMEGKGSRLSGAADTLIMRETSNGHFENVQHRRSKGNHCKNEHPKNGGPVANRNSFAPLQNASSSHVASGSNRVPISGRDFPYKLDKATIVNDLSKERPQWILSAYGAGREAPIQLFGGLPREQSFEELRVRHYELVAQGRQQEVIQEAQSLVSNAEQQIQTALKDVDGAIKYVNNGEHEHPNRIDAVNAKGVLPTEAQMSGQAQQPALAFGQSFSIAPTFGQPSAPPAFGRPSAPSFGQPSAPASTLGQPSVSGFGQSPAFGQSATLGRPTTSFGQSASAFGKPLAPTQTFGQSSTPLPFGAQQQKPSPFGSLAGPSTITLPPSAANQPNNPFGQLPGAAQPSPFGQLSAPSQTNVFGRPSAPSSTNPFNRSAISGIATSIAPPNTFSQPSGPVPTADSGHPPAAASTITSQSSKTCISYVNRVVPNFGFSLESLISSQTSFYSADIPKAQTASGPISRPAATGPTSVQALTSVPAAEGSSAKISNWKGKPVSYIGDEPCFKSNGDWQRIWFSHGPPVFSKTPGLPEEVYTSSLKNEYGFAEENGVFKNGIMPEVPPKREWCNWDF